MYTCLCIQYIYHQSITHWPAASFSKANKKHFQLQIKAHCSVMCEVASGNAAKLLQIEDLSLFSFTLMAVSLVDPKQW